MKSDFSQIIQSVKNTASGLMDHAASSATTETKAVLNKLENVVGVSRQTLSHLTTNLAQSVSGLEEATTTLKTSVLEATGGAVDAINKTSNQAAIALKETTVQATDVLNHATNVAVSKLDQATNAMTQTTEKTTLALNSTLQKTEQLSGTLSHSVQNVVATSMKGWMAEHPIVAWGMAHPLWSIALVILILFLVWSLLGAVAQLTQRAWLAVLQAPLKATQSLSRGMVRSFQRADAVSSPKLDGQQEIQARLAEILHRLQALRQEEDVLMKEMQAILILKIEE